MVFYELCRSNPVNYFYHQSDANLTCPPHLHNSFEWICVTGGCMHCVVSDRDTVLRAGEAALILPDEVHFYRTERSSRSFLCIFSCDLVPDFYAQVKGRRFCAPSFCMPCAEAVRVLSLEHASRFLIKSVLYQICGTALEQCALAEGGQADPGLSARIITYLQEHYTQDISLKTMARELGYHYSYLSAFLNRNLHASFPAFLSRYRTDYSKELLKGGDLTITQIASLCGFNTLRSFNRAFAQLCGTAPSAFRAQCRRAAPAQLSAQAFPR